MICPSFTGSLVSVQKESFFPDRGAGRRRRTVARLEKGNEKIKFVPATFL